MSEMLLKHNQDGTLWIHDELGSFVLTRKQIRKFKGMNARYELALSHFEKKARRPFWFGVGALFFVAFVVSCAAGGTA